MDKIKGKFLAPNVIGGAPLSQAGDADFTAVNGAGRDRQIIVYNAAVTAPRAVTLPTAGARLGQVVRLTRTANASGASAVTFAGKSIAVSQWAEAVFDGSAWILAQFGSL